MIRRRDFIASGTAFAALEAASPRRAAAMSPYKPIVGVLSTGAEKSSSYLATALIQGLKENGYTDGENLLLKWRWADGRYDHLKELTSDLIGDRAVMLVTLDGTPAARAAKEATTTLPIVFVIGGDPVALGLVGSLSHPGGNVTGITGLTAGLGSKRLQLLHELIPQAKTIGVLLNPDNPNTASEIENIRAAAATLGLILVTAQARSADEFSAAFESLKSAHAQGLAVQTEPLFTSHREEVVALAARYALPAVHAYREFTEIGGLMSYGGSQTEARRLAGGYAARILKGEKPADLPVQQAARVELVINATAAKALGITVPVTLLGRADTIIE